MASAKATVNTKTLGNGPVQVVELPVIKYSALVDGNADEAAKLFQAASSDGFFQLDLTNSSASATVLDNLAAVYKVGEEYFDQPAAVKAKDERVQDASLDRGFKTSSCDETFEISRDELIANQPELPAVFHAKKQLITDFSNGLDEACRIMLDSLSTSLGLTGDESLAKHHKETESSESGLKFIDEPTLARLADVGDNLHTDGGTFTVVFCEKDGLQTYLPSVDQWAFVPPKAGCAVLNVANALSKMSQGKLHSPQHRVTQMEDGAQRRIYLSYFLRPTHAAKAALKI